MFLENIQTKKFFLELFSEKVWVLQLNLQNLAKMSASHQNYGGAQPNVDSYCSMRVCIMLRPTVLCYDFGSFGKLNVKNCSMSGPRGIYYMCVHRANRDPKLARLPIGHLVGSNIAPWNVFCHTKNLKVPPFPIIQCNAIKR